MQTGTLEKVCTKKINLPKKRILVLISEGGGGHKMAGEALKDIFSTLHEIEVVTVFTQII